MTSETSAVRALIAQWRRQAGHERTFTAPLGGKAIARGIAGVLDNCADELESALTGADGGPPRHPMKGWPLPWTYDTLKEKIIAADGHVVCDFGESDRSEADELAQWVVAVANAATGADGGPQSQEPHHDCHDLVCNAGRQHPRGAQGVGCSCRGREERLQRDLDRAVDRIVELEKAGSGADGGDPLPPPRPSPSPQEPKA